MEKVKTNKMGVVPIRKILIFMGIPMIISMALQALYNIIDTIFVTGIGGDEAKAANTALGLAFPVQMLMVAIAIGTGVGANALLSRSLGQGDKEKVNKTAGNAIFMGFIIYAVYLLFGLFCAKPFAKLFSPESEVIAEMTAKYIRICCTCSIGIVFFGVYEKLLQSTGKTLFSTIAQISGALANIILDPVFIYEKGKGIGLFGMGIEGAAVATVIGQVLSTILAMIFHYSINKEIKNHIKYLKPDGKLILEIYKIGLPAIIAQALMSFMAMGMNLILGILDKQLIADGIANSDSPAYVPAYGDFYKVQQFVLFLAFGLRDAITPILSFNYGMGSKKRVKQGIFYGIVYVTVLMAIGIILLECIPGVLTGLFDEGMTELANKFCVNAMRIVAASLIFAGINIALQGIFQALGSGLASLIISVCRQLVFVIPVALIFALIAKQDPANMDWLVWITFIISEGLSTVIAVFMMRSIYKKKVANLGAEVPAESVALLHSEDGAATAEAEGKEEVSSPATEEIEK